MTRKLFFIAVLAAVSFMSGCEPAGLSGVVSGNTDDDKDVQETVDDSVLRLMSFSFRKQHNTALSDDVLTVISDTDISDGEGVCYHADPFALVASFEVFSSDELEDVTVSVSVAGENSFSHIASGRTVFDYMRPVTIRLSAVRDGKEIVRDYDFRFHNLNTGLPVLYLFTSDGSPVESKDIWKEGCRIYLDAKGRKDFDGTVFDADYYGENDNLKGRGNTTWEWNKKPYAIKLDKKAGLLGMPKHKRWALLANAIDRSMMRNRLAFEIAGRCDGLEWTPRSRFVEVVLNGRHMGTYLLVEQIRTDKDRVPVPSGNDALDPAKGGGPDADPSQMGFLMEIDRYWGNMQYEQSSLWWQSGRYNGNGSSTFPNSDRVSWASSVSYHTNYGSRGEKFNYGLKDPDDEALLNVSSIQFRYIRDYVLDTEKAVLRSPYDFSRIDADSFIDYWLVFELTLNQEPNNPGSCYMYKKPDPEGGKLFAGPVWDFDYGTFNPDYHDDGHYYDKRSKFLNLNTLWYVGLFENPSFRDAVRERWSRLKPKLDLEDFMNMNKDYISVSAGLDYDIWGNHASHIDPNGENQMSATEAADRIYRNFSERVSDLDRLISTMP